MADEFQGVVCGESWWSNSSRNMLGSSLCSSDIGGGGGFGWSTEFLDLKTNRSSSDDSASDESSSLVFHHDVKNPHYSDSGAVGPGDFPMDWNQALMQNNGSSESNYPFMLQEDLNSGINYRQIQKDSIGFPLMDSSSYNVYTSNLLQTLFDETPQSLDQSMNYTTCTQNYLPCLNDFSPSLPKLPKQPPVSQLPFSNNTSSWKTLGLPSTQIQMPSSKVYNKINLPSLTIKPNDGEVAKKTNDEPSFKRQRIETPSPLPTFKVRKEKLGDRVTALQQLVSPFGKTDTASVLHEAIECIKYLQDQVNILSTPYLKNGSPGQRQQNVEKIPEQGQKQDLRSRGLCLVPISTTFPVAAETTADFWTPTFGGGFR